MKLLSQETKVFDGQAIFQSPNSSALMGAAPHNRQGVASGFLATGRVVGQSINVALSGAIFTGLGGSVAGALLIQRGLHASQQFASGNILESTFTDAFHVTFTVCALLAALGVFTSLVRGKEEPQWGK